MKRKKQTKNIGAWITPGEHRALKGIAKEQQRKVSGLLRREIVMLIDREKAGGMTYHVEEKFDVQIIRGLSGHKLITLRDNEAHDPDGPDYDPDADHDYDILMHPAEAEDLANKLRDAAEGD